MNEAYGKLPPEEYLALRAKAEAPIALEETFREDYELGVADGSGSLERGTFYVTYRGKCMKDGVGCGFDHTFKHEAVVEVGG